MKINNFVFSGYTGIKIERVYYATVDVTYGIWPFRQTINRNITRKYGGYWFFTDDGKFVPGSIAEELERAWCAKRKASCLEDTANDNA